MWVLMKFYVRDFLVKPDKDDGHYMKTRAHLLRRLAVLMEVQEILCQGTYKAKERSDRV
jgi:hypothetical protein